MRWSSLAFVIPFLFPVMAQAGDLCGTQSGKFSDFIPDLVANGLSCNLSSGQLQIPGLPSANFEKSCVTHDSCYWTNGSDRLICDEVLLVSLHAECRKTYGTAADLVARDCCLMAADALTSALHNTNSRSFEIAQDEARALAESFSRHSGIPFGPGLSAMAADSCATHSIDEHCQVEVVSSILLEHLSQVKQLYASLLDSEPTGAEQIRLLDLFRATGRQLPDLRKLIISENATNIIKKKAEKELGLIPSANDLSRLSAILNSFDLAYFEASFYATYPNEAVSYLYTKAHGREISPTYRTYYANTLQKTKELSRVKELIQRHVN